MAFTAKNMPEYRFSLTCIFPYMDKTCILANFMQGCQRNHPDFYGKLRLKLRLKLRFANLK